MLNVYGMNSIADFFEKFRNTCLHNYRLDPVHYYTAPGLAWDGYIGTYNRHRHV